MPLCKLIEHNIFVFGEIYNLYHFNIIKYTYNSVTKIARAWLPPSTFFHFEMYACTHTQAFITIYLKVCLC